MTKIKNPRQLEYCVRGNWMPEGSIFDWEFVTSVRKVQVFTRAQFIKWAKRMNLKLLGSPKSIS